MLYVFIFKQKTAYEMRISDWSSDVCSSDLMFANIGPMAHAEGAVAIGQAAEEAGFESLWAVEHTVVPAGYQSQYPYSDDGRMPGGEDFDIPDPLLWLTYFAA